MRSLLLLVIIFSLFLFSACTDSADSGPDGYLIALDNSLDALYDLAGPEGPVHPCLVEAEGPGATPCDCSMGSVQFESSPLAVTSMFSDCEDSNGNIFSGNVSWWSEGVLPEVGGHWAFPEKFGDCTEYDGSSPFECLEGTLFAATCDGVIDECSYTGRDLGDTCHYTCE